MTLMAARWGAGILWLGSLITLGVELHWEGGLPYGRSVLIFLLVGAGTLSVGALTLRLIDFHAMTYAMGRVQGVREERVRTMHAQSDDVIALRRAKNG